MVSFSLNLSISKDLCLHLVSSFVRDGSGTSNLKVTAAILVVFRHRSKLNLACSARTTITKTHGNNSSSVVMETLLKEINDDSIVGDVDDNPTSARGVKDVYGEERATEDQFVTPWSISVATGYTLLRDPHFNKGLAFTEKEREHTTCVAFLPLLLFLRKLRLLCSYMVVIQVLTKECMLGLVLIMHLAVGTLEGNPLDTTGIIELGGASAQLQLQSLEHCITTTVGTERKLLYFTRCEIDGFWEVWVLHCEAYNHGNVLGVSKIIDAPLLCSHMVVIQVLTKECMLGLLLIMQLAVGTLEGNPLDTTGIIELGGTSTQVWNIASQHPWELRESYCTLQVFAAIGTSISPSKLPPPPQGLQL